jgi:hypothetical protein
LLGFALALIASAGLCAVPLLSFAGWLAGADTSARAGGSPLRLPADLHYLLPYFAKTAPHVESTMYVGMVALLAGCLGWLLVLIRRLRVSVLGLYSLLLGLVALILVFQIVPPIWLSWVPGLSNNSWSRAILILDIALAAAAAYSLDELRTRLRIRAVFVTLMGVLIACQVVDTARLFRQFNGPVDDHYFYPRDALITHVQEHIGPFQSVVADNNFLVSGTLGAYGIHEWLAHGFNNPSLVDGLGKLATDPFTTPTATSIEAEGFRLNSPMMGALGIRYALGDSGLAYSNLTPSFREPSQVLPPNRPIPALPDNAVVQKFSLDESYRLVAIGIRLATYGKSGLKGEVTLRLYKDDSSVPLARVPMMASSITDNMMASFQLATPLDLAPGQYRFALDYTGAGQDKLTAWYTPTAGTHCSLVINGAPTAGCLDMQLSSMRADAGPFVPVASNHGIHLLENTDVPSGPYFVERLDEWPHRESSSDVLIRDHKSHEFDLEYRGGRAGYVVVPMNLLRGWQVKLDGRIIDPGRYLGGLPAVKVSGVASIKFRYMPYSIQYGKWISLLTLLVLLFAASLPFWPRSSSTLSGSA